LKIKNKNILNILNYNIFKRMSIIDFNVRGLNKATFFNSHLTLNDTNNANNDYSGGVTEFNYTNTDADNKLFVSSLNIKILDDGTFNLSEYGSLGTTAINGINIYYTSVNGTVRNNIIGTTFNINANSDYFNYTTDITIEDLGTGDSLIGVDLNFQKNRAPIKLGVTDKIVVELNDDFSNLTQHTFQISGFTYPESDII
jgi:hypothetical protein